MSVSLPIKVVQPQVLDSHNTTSVTIELHAAPGLLSRPAEIILLLDDSRRITQQQLHIMKDAALRLLDTLATASGGHPLSHLGNGTQAALISFSGSTANGVQLTDALPSLRQQVEQLTISTCDAPKDAIAEAQALFPADSARRKVLILFSGSCPRESEIFLPAGIEFYTIAIPGCSIPPSEYISKSCHTVCLTGSADDSLLLKKLSVEIVQAGIINGEILEELCSEFEILRTGTPSHGSVKQLSSKILRWEIGTAGESVPETVSLTFQIHHIGNSHGSLPISRVSTYRALHQATLQLSSPSITIRPPCKIPIQPQPCPVPATFAMDSCQDSVVVDLQDVGMTALGRIIHLNLTLKQICPGKKVAVAVLLTEIRPGKGEFSRGMKFFTVPAHDHPGCVDVILRCIPFVVPEDNCTPCGCSLCGKRLFNARVMANYLDTDYMCSSEEHFCCHCQTSLQDSE